MPKKKKRPLVIGVGFSPRQGGNSDQMLEWALAGAAAAGSRTRTIFMRDLEIGACRGCRYCETAGECVQKDGFSEFCRTLEAADYLIVSSPVFFLNVPARAKAVIDRFQLHWSRKYLLGRPVKRENRPALALMVSGADQADIFECVKRTLWAWFSVAGFKSRQMIGLAGADAKGAVSRVPGQERKIRRAARKLVKA